MRIDDPDQAFLDVVCALDKYQHPCRIYTACRVLALLLARDRAISVGVVFKQLHDMYFDTIDILEVTNKYRSPKEESDEICREIMAACR